ncbi:oxidoreductase [Paramyrothecium foliicola]|nr:oxidoreductase [Paramyrothecium foliicola]
MSSPYKRVLLVGATSGIGAALADKFIAEGAKVIAVGRRQDRLDVYVQKHGSDKASGIKYDITDKEHLDSFVKNVIDSFPDLDCVFLNSGIQSQIRLSRPEEVNLDAFHDEISTNFNRIVDLSVKFLPHLRKKPFPTALIFTGTLLAHVPAVTMPAYSASKAALSAYVQCLRRQNTEFSTNIIELWPPAVQTELHDYMGEGGRSFGMSVDVFVQKTWPEIVSGTDHIIIGAEAMGFEKAFHDAVTGRRQQFEKVSDMMLGHFQL